jgi:protein SCO1/2
MTRLAAREAGALGALVGILAITALWWALALWPLSPDVAPWLVRTRAVCFGAVINGLPTTAGWMVLIGQPVYMLAALWLISGQTLGAGLKALLRFPAGRAAVGATAFLIVAGVSSAAVRVARAAPVEPASEPAAASGEPIPRVDREAPPLALRDQHAEALTLARFRGRPILLTFAFAHCSTVCPLIVRDVLAAQRMAAGRRPVVVVVTLDPWRDQTTRLPAIATQWELGPDAYVLSGAVADVERTLDAWNVGRGRDPRTGNIDHGSLVYVLDGRGRIAFTVSGAGDAATFAGLLERL